MLVLKHEHVTLLLISRPALLVAAVEGLGVLEAVAREVQADRVLAQRLPEVPLSGNQVAIPEVDILLVNALPDLLKLFLEANSGQYIV